MLQQIRSVMQLVMVNFLVMFNVVFIFFLFLVAVTCIINYMPSKRRCKEECEQVEDDVIPPPPLFAGGDDEAGCSRDTYVVITPPIESVGDKDTCPVHVV